MSDLPAWYPDPEEAKPAPVPLLLVQGFVNTDDPDTGVDLLIDNETARPWLIAAGLLDTDVPLSPAELAQARSLREGIRSLLTADFETRQLTPLRKLARTHRPELTVDDRGLLAVENDKHDDL